MLLHTIAYRTNSEPVNLYPQTQDFTVETDINIFEIGDVLMNVHTGQVARLYDYGDSPYYGDDRILGYVVGNGWSDYWEADDCVLIAVSPSNR